MLYRLLLRKFEFGFTVAAVKTKQTSSHKIQATNNTVQSIDSDNTDHKQPRRQHNSFRNLTGSECYGTDK